jgi:hypothetical protein
MRKPFYTPIRRNHIVGPLGVGSIVVSRSGVTVLMTGLEDWIRGIKADGPDITSQNKIRVERMNAYELHDFALENTLDVQRFIQPPIIEGGEADSNTWFIPSTRFPLAEYCTSPWCNTITFARTPDDPSVGSCSRADCQKTRKHAWKTQQVPVLLCCPSGHLDEVDWFAEVHEGQSCTYPDLEYRETTDGGKPQVRCRFCGAMKYFGPSGRGQSIWTTKCTGRRAWLPESSNEPCHQEMKLLLRTATQVYFPDVRSSLHLPAPDGLRDSVVRWLQEDSVANAFVRIQGGDQIEISAKIHQRATVVFPDLKLGELEEHIKHVRTGTLVGPDAGRAGEVKALTAGKRGRSTVDGPPVLDPELLPGESFNSSRFGPEGLFSKVVAVHRLAETRVLAGFTRDTPPDGERDIREGLAQMWGSIPGKDSEMRSWLPAHRVYGEGIYLEFTQKKVDAWLNKTVGAYTPEVLRQHILSQKFLLAHTLAHLLINVVSLECGYPTASIRDRIYDEDGVLGLLVYTAAGDSVGTMGGLVELARPGKLEHVLEKALANGRWCGLDPICISPLDHEIENTPGACHQCCFLPETSCEWFNHALDRATLIGRDATLGFLDVLQ